MNTTTKVLALINPDAGPGDAFSPACDGIRKTWETPGTDLKFQFSSSRDDGYRKARAAVDDGVNIILAVGGDGVVNTVGAALINTPTHLGVIPTGSGNGFARHFDIPLDPYDAALQLRQGRAVNIDVGRVNGVPFIVTGSFAWEVDILKAYEATSMRGILPYVLAAVQGAFKYTPQPIGLNVDDDDPITIEDPLLCTVANLTQYGGGVKIAPSAQPDDGQLELVYMQRNGLPHFLNRLPDFLEGRLDSIPELNVRSFQKLRVERKQRAAIQLDGELVEGATTLEIDIVPGGLGILIPGSG